MVFRPGLLDDDMEGELGESTLTAFVGICL